MQFLFNSKLTLACEIIFVIYILGNALLHTLAALLLVTIISKYTITDLFLTSANLSEIAVNLSEIVFQINWQISVCVRVINYIAQRYFRPFCYYIANTSKKSTFPLNNKPNVKHLLPNVNKSHCSLEYLIA